MKKHTQIMGLVAALTIGTMALTGASAASADAGSPNPATASIVSAGTSYNDIAAAPDSNSPDCIACGVPMKKATKVSGPVLVSKKFVKYLTGAWARSTGYAWNASTTVDATIDASVGMSAAGASGNIGVSASMTKSYSITVNIAASSSKYSKLGLASNFNRYYVKSTYYQNGKQLAGSAWTYGYLYSPTKDQYLVVYYQ
ncbi:hypothetical protein ACI2IP_05120 [Microbacterium sp. NPDC090218]